MRYRTIILATLALMLLSGHAFAAVDALAYIADLSGRVRVMAAGDEDWQSAKVGMVLSEGMKVKTEKRASAVIKFKKGHSIQIDPLTVFEITALEISRAGGSEKTGLDMESGRVLIRVKELDVKGGSTFTIRTPTARAGVRGTKFIVEVGDEKTKLTVLEGQVSVMAEGAEEMVGRNHQIVVQQDKAPSEPEVVPNDVVDELNEEIDQIDDEPESTMLPEGEDMLNTGDGAVDENVEAAFDQAVDDILQSELVEEYTTPGGECCNK